MTAAAAADPVALASDPAASAYARRQAIRDVLGKRDPQAAALCGRLLRDPDRFLRREAAKGLVALGGRAAAVALAAVVTDEDEDVRRAALQALRAAKDPGFRDAIATLAKDKSFVLRREAEAALKELDALASGPPAPAAAPAPMGGRSALPPWKAAGSEARADAPSAGPPRVLAPERPLEPLPVLEPLPELEPLPVAAPLPRLAPTSGEPPLVLEPIPDRTPPPRDAKARILAAVRERLRQGGEAAAAATAGGSAAQRVLATVQRKTGLRPAPGAVPLAAAAPARALLSADRCRKCGWALKTEQRFCVFCGTPRTPGVAPAPVRAALPAAPVGREGRADRTGGLPRLQPMPRPAPRKSGSGVGGCLVLLVIVVVVGGWIVSGVGATVRRMTPDAPHVPTWSSPVGGWVRVTLQSGERFVGLVELRTPNEVRYRVDGRVRSVKLAYIADETAVAAPGSRSGRRRW